MVGLQDPAALESALHRILAWRGFQSSPRLARFLRTVVEWTIAGRGPDLKESTIGVAVFDRAPNYDPRTDPIVRVQAVRLRSKLIEYYATEGIRDQIAIELPSRGYVPVFRNRREPAPDEAKSSIAVLPFTDMSQEQNLQFFCDGVAEQILHHLAQNPRLRVVARTSSFLFRSPSEDLRAIGESLGVSTILVGSVRLWNTRVRITAQLTSAADGFHIWSQSFDREFEDIFQIQDEIAHSIASRLGAVEPAFPVASTRFEVYRAVLLGRHHLARQTPSDFIRALDCFQQAAAADPGYAMAWSGIALALLYQTFFGLALPSAVATTALDAAAKAVQLAPEHYESHLALGAVKAVLQFELVEGLAEYEDAIALDPSASDAHDFRSLALTCQGREREALESAEKARRLDPLSARIQENLAFTKFQFRHHAESERVYRELVSREPYYALGWLGLAWNAIVTGRPVEALKTIEHLETFLTGWPFLLGTRGYALARAGREPEARSLLSEPGVIQSAGCSYEKALVAVGLGEAAAALDCLEQAFKHRIGWMLFIGVNPLLDPLRSEPRFQRLLDNILRQDNSR